MCSIPPGSGAPRKRFVLVLPSCRNTPNESFRELRCYRNTPNESVPELRCSRNPRLHRSSEVRSIACGRHESASLTTDNGHTAPLSLQQVLAMSSPEKHVPEPGAECVHGEKRGASMVGNIS
jgi:hypothetical protein